MTSLAAPIAADPPLIAQPILRAGDERCPLPPGAPALGGRADESRKLAPLGNQARAATITVFDDGGTLLQRTTAAVMGRIDGQTIGIDPVELRHGDTIDFADCRLTFEADAATARHS